MSWYYSRVFDKAGAAPLGGDSWDNSRNPAYEFFEETDPTRVANMNKVIANGGNNGGLFGPFASLSAAQAQATKTPPQSGVQQMNSETTPIPGLSQLGSLESGVVGFLGALADPHTWLRVAEVILGLVLIAVGLAKLTNAVPIATRTAAKAAKIGAVFA